MVQSPKCWIEWMKVYDLLRSSMCYRLPWWPRGQSLPAIQETRIQTLVQEDPLEMETATHTSIPAWRNPHRQRSLAGYIHHGVPKNRTRLSDFTLTFIFFLCARCPASRALLLSYSILNSRKSFFFFSLLLQIK